MIDRLVFIKPEIIKLWDQESFKSFVESIDKYTHDGLLNLKCQEPKQEAVGWYSEELANYCDVCGLVLPIDPIELERKLNSAPAKEHITNARQAFINLHIGIVADYRTAIESKATEERRDWTDFKAKSALSRVGVVVFNQRVPTPGFAKRWKEEFGLPVPINTADQLGALCEEADTPAQPRRRVNIIWSEGPTEQPAALTPPVAVFAQPSERATGATRYGVVVNYVLKAVVTLKRGPPPDIGAPDSALIVINLGEAKLDKCGGLLTPNAAKGISAALEKALPIVVVYKDDGTDTARRNLIVSALGSATRSKLDFWDLVTPASAPEIHEIDRYLVVRRREPADDEGVSIKDYVNFRIHA